MSIIIEDFVAPWELKVGDRIVNQEDCGSEYVIVDIKVRKSAENSQGLNIIRYDVEMSSGDIFELDPFSHVQRVK